MNYELAKKLKDAGFPQDLAEGAFYWHGPTVKKRRRWEGYGKGEEDAKDPTLMELIEACGSQFGKLEKCDCIYPNKCDHACPWDARPRDEKINNEHADKWVGRGETPKEAVANLWLKLNEK